MNHTEGENVCLFICHIVQNSLLKYTCHVHVYLLVLQAYTSIPQQISNLRSSALKMEAVSSYETLKSTYNITQRHYPEVKH
jgi:hypothetical protein